MTSCRSIVNRPCNVCQRDTTHYGLACGTCHTPTPLLEVEFIFGGRRSLRSPIITEGARRERDRARKHGKAALERARREARQQLASEVKG